MAETPILEIRGLAKSFVLHTQTGVRLPVFRDVAFDLNPGDFMAIAGPSGSGKSSLMRMVYGNFHCAEGSILVHQATGKPVDVARAPPQAVLELRRSAMGYVSQFLRVIPRVSTLDVVMEPALHQGMAEAEAKARAKALLSRLRIPERLWGLSPTTFSGGEQQRVNLARGFVARYPLLLLDEPTASLDAENRETVLEMTEEALREGVAILGILHDREARERLATCTLDLTLYRDEAA